MWNKLKESGPGLIFVIFLSIGLYAALPNIDIKAKSKILQPSGTKTVEEIIAGSYTKNYKQDTQEWDTTFKSAIIPIKD